MRVAVRYSGALVDSDGRVAGHDAGATLVRRLLRVFPNSILVGPRPRQCEGFDVMPLEFVDGEETLVITMDVIDATCIWRTLKATCDEPKVMNFVWWNASEEYHHLVNQALLGLSFALFPTFANSERTASEVREIVETVGRALADEGFEVSPSRLRVPDIVGRFAERADALIQSTGRYVQQVHVLGEMNKHIACDVSAARLDLGYEPEVELYEGMRRSIRWCVEQGLELA